MIGDSLFIQSVDHRVSTALIFFLLMVLLNNRKPKQKFGLRALAAFVAMCAVSWTLRTVIDVGIASEIVQGLEYGVYTIAMSLMFLFGYSLCYYTTPGELLYIDLLALTIVKMAWNFFINAIFRLGILCNSRWRLLILKDCPLRESIIGAAAGGIGHPGLAIGI